MKPTSTHHAIDYIEISVTDIAEAKRFYAAAFDWKFTDYGPTYAGIQGDGREMGGMTQVEQVTRGGPLVVLYSADLDAPSHECAERGARSSKNRSSSQEGGGFILRIRPVTNSPFGQSGNQCLLLGDGSHSNVGTISIGSSPTEGGFAFQEEVSPPRESSGSGIVVVRNWFQELTKRVPRIPHPA